MNVLSMIKKYWWILLLVIFYILATVLIISTHGGLRMKPSYSDDEDRNAVASTVVGQIDLPISADSADIDVSDYSALTDSDLGELPSYEELVGEASEEEEVHYYRFTTITKIQRLHVRTGPGLNYDIIEWLPKGTTGIIITLGDEWSYLRADNAGQTIGYCYNGYLDLTEIAPEDYPEELKSITPPIAP
ncbi:MAG: SH3 domain-containing protein [Lachnospiraceae bacterium]|nr:SH3 domain-containing protein [Lachnospiraceae bacterium]